MLLINPLLGLIEIAHNSCHPHVSDNHDVVVQVKIMWWQHITVLALYTVKTQ